MARSKVSVTLRRTSAGSLAYVLESLVGALCVRTRVEGKTVERFVGDILGVDEAESLTVGYSNNVVTVKKAK